MVIIMVQACTNKEDYKEFHPNGTVKIIGQLLDGKKKGDWVSFDSLGVKVRVSTYQNDTLIYRKIFTNGKLFATEEMKGENKHGSTKTYHENGSVKGVTNYFDGLQIGEQLFYYPDGTLESKYTETEEGTMEFYQYYPNGQLLVYGSNFQDGVLNLYDSIGNRTYDLLFERGELKDTLEVY